MNVEVELYLKEEKQKSGPAFPNWPIWTRFPSGELERDVQPEMDHEWTGTSSSQFQVKKE